MLFSACETDFDVNAEWEETTVVFGLLDDSKDIQYIKINKAFFDTQPMSEAWIQEAINDLKLPSFTKKNADHYLKVRAYIFWMYPECLSQVLEGKKTVDVFTELMNACNVFNFPHRINGEFID